MRAALARTDTPITSKSHGITYAVTAFWSSAVAATSRTSATVRAASVCDAATSACMNTSGTTGVFSVKIVMTPS